jgi:hypothetical protein
MSEWNDDALMLIATYPSIDLALLFCDNEKCTNHSRVITTKWCDDIAASYLLMLRCNKCNNEWKVCKHCVLKKKLIKTDQIRSHKWKYHDRKRKALSLLDIDNFMTKRVCYNRPTMENGCNVIENNLNRGK